MNFGDAIVAMKAGHRVSRAGWNGKGMWIALTPGSEIPNESARSGAVKMLADDRPGNITICGHIDMKTADGNIVCGWLASQTDMLVEDWDIVP